MKTIHYHELTPELAMAGCLVEDMPNEDYHAYQAISKSGLDLISRSPAHYMYAAARQPSRAMEIGTAIHTALLEPERFRDEYVLLDKVKDRRASEYKSAVKVHGSERVLVASEAAHVSGMQEQVLSHTPLPAGYSELSVFAKCPEAGVLMKCRFDRLTPDFLAIDVKKTRDSRPDEFAKSVYNYRYHVQDAFYRYVFECATGSRLAGFEFLAIEELPPHSSAFYELCEESQQIGRESAMNDLHKYAECVSSNDWPTYGGRDKQIISLPSWAMAQYEDSLVEDIV